MALTPAAARLKRTLMEAHDSPDIETFWNEVASAVLNVEGVNARYATGALSGVLKSEFPLISADEALWMKASAGMLAKLESLGYHLVKKEDLT